MKDFLFFNYSWVPNSTTYFQSFVDAGYDCDIIDETTLYSFEPTCKYQVVVMYLHCKNATDCPTIGTPPSPVGPRARINHWLDTCLKDSFLVQHDTTDSAQIQKWTNRTPDLIMQRELFDGTRIPDCMSVEPFHFPIPSVYDPSYEPVNDVMFYGCMTNKIRRPFADRIIDLSQGSLSHLKWDIKITNNGQRTPDEYKKAINQCKIGLHYFGNSRDSIRIWEIASTKAAIIMPKLRMKSTSEGYMPFNEYVAIEDDFSDLEEKILYVLENDRWKSLGEESFQAFEQRHSPQHCFNYYRDTLKKYFII